MEMKKVAILGSTGSIGTQSLDIIDQNPEMFQVEVLSCGNRTGILKEQIKKYAPKIAVTGTEEGALGLIEEQKIGLYKGTEILWGQEGLKTAAAESEADILLNSLMGISGLAPTMAAIESGKDIALANKETLVAGGQLVTDAVKRHGVKMLPVDSEHSAIFQCLEGNQNRKIKKILLTASGGPFRGYTMEQLEQVTLAQALKHPKWNMGRKITIDSATMMNKGLEVIEAKWLFGVDVDDIQILVHPQSIVHSAVEFMDTSVIAQLGIPDMRIPISLALGYPDRIESDSPSLNFFEEGANLTFHKPDPEVFRCIKMAYEASRAGGSYPVAMNGANEVLVDLFLNEKIRFIDIQRNLEKIMDAHNSVASPDLESLLQIDKDIREITYKVALG